MSIIRRVGEFEVVNETAQVLGGANSDVLIDIGLSGGYATTGAPGIAVAGDIGALRVAVGALGNINADIQAAGGIGTVDVRFAANASGTVSANATSGGIGAVRVEASGGSAGGTVQLDAQGSIGDISVLGMNLGYSDIDVYASAWGGDIGNLDLQLVGGMAKGEIYARAQGGSIGDIDFRIRGASGSGDVRASALAVLDAAGNAVGGNIGDIRVEARGASADPEVRAYAHGEYSAGVYKGGGNIGDITVMASGGSAEADVDAYAYSGGSIGNITVVNRGQNAHSASAQVDAYAYGGGGRVATIGNIDVTVDHYRGRKNSGTVNAYAYSGGDIGNITVRASDVGGTSADIDIRASAFAGAAGGGNIGDIRVSNTSWAGNTDINLEAGTRIGAVTASIGGGSANLYIRASGAADIGNIAVTFDTRHTATSNSLALTMADGPNGSDVGFIRIAGGSRVSNFDIGQDDEVGRATSIAGVDLASFNGSAKIRLGEVDNGTVIRASRFGSDIAGTQGSDTIHLGAGADTVRLELTSAADTVFGFRTGAGGDKLDIVANASSLSAVTAANTAMTVADGDILRLVDIAGGQNVTTGTGLLAALNGGEFAGIDATANTTATFVTAATAGATRWFVFHGVENTGDADFDAVTLLAVVNSTGAISALDLSVFL